MSRPEAPAAQPYGRRPYVRILGGLALLIFVLIAINALVTRQSGLHGVEPGHRLPAFAVPLVLGDVNGDSDIATHANDGAAGRVPACQERGAQLLNVCQLYERGPVVLALFIDAGSCPQVLADMQALAPSFPGVRFAAVAIKGDRNRLRSLVRSWHLSFPVGIDRDGALAGLYKLVSCPQVSFAYPGGVVQSAALEVRPSRAVLRARVSELVAAARVRGWKGAAGVSPTRPFEATLGWCTREVEEDLPEVRLLQAEIELGAKVALLGDSPREIRERLRELSNRFGGGRAVGVRREPVPAAYRVFFRHIGLDPDVVRTPIEAVVFERMLRGGFLSGGVLRDVLLIALVDTGVPVWALDADSLDGPLGIRPSREGERLGRFATGPALPTGRLVVADASAPVAVLFGQLGPQHAPAAGSRRLALFSIGVPGVPALFVEEALWNCHSALAHL